MTTSPLNNPWAQYGPWTRNSPWALSNPRTAEPRARRERRRPSGDDRPRGGSGGGPGSPFDGAVPDFEAEGERTRGRRGPGRRGPSPFGMLNSEADGERGGRGRGRGPGGRGPGGDGPEGPGRRGGHHRGPRGWGEGPGGPRFGRGRKAGRGDIRAAVLVLLSEEPMHGYQMIRELSERSGGAWRASPGSVYPTLQQLEDEGLIHTDASTGKRVFALTDAGRAHIAALPAGTPAPWEALADAKDIHELRELVGRLAAAVVQVDEAGTDAQRGRTAELLKEARRAVYLVLADDESPTA